jgi:hypothetical protein
MGLWALLENKHYTPTTSTSGSWPCLLFSHIGQIWVLSKWYHTFKNFKKKQWLKLHNISHFALRVWWTQALYIFKSYKSY